MDSEALPLTLYSAPGCCLCETLQAQLAELQDEFPMDVRRVDITGSVELEERFRTEIPVLFVRERKVVKYRISTPALRELLARALGRPGAGFRPLR